jgi:hypothetical protein
MNKLAIEILGSVMRAPTRGGDAVDWENFREKLGFDLPADYKAFATYYGGGSIDDTLYIPSLVGEYDTWLREYANAQAELHYDSEKALTISNGPVADLPDGGALVPWGISPNSDICCWYVTGEDADNWPVVVFRNRQRPAWHRYDGSFLWFIYGAVVGQIENPFGVDFPTEGGSADYLNWRDEKFLRESGIFTFGYVHDRQNFFDRVSAAGFDPLDYFQSAATHWRR